MPQAACHVGVNLASLEIAPHSSSACAIVRAFRDESGDVMLTALALNGLGFEPVGHVDFFDFDGKRSYRTALEWNAMSPRAPASHKSSTCSKPSAAP